MAGCFFLPDSGRDHRVDLAMDQPAKHEDGTAKTGRWQCLSIVQAPIDPFWHVECGHFLHGAVCIVHLSAPVPGDRHGCRCLPVVDDLAGHRRSRFCRNHPDRHFPENRHVPRPGLHSTLDGRHCTFLDCSWRRCRGSVCIAGAVGPDRDGGTCGVVVVVGQGVAQGC
ncbi:hypothetical protein D3C86_1631030 [compost metagenome]